MSGLVLGALLLAPLAWSGIVTALRMRLAGPALQDAFEKRLLAIQLAPIAFGVAAIPIAQWAPRPLFELPSAPSLPIFADAQPAAPQPAAPLAAEPAQHAPPLLPLLIWTCLGVYVAVATVRVLMLVLAFARIARIAAASRPAQIAGASVRITDRDAPPLAYGRDAIILPARLIASLSEADLATVIAHEREHLRRGDVRYYALLAWIDALVWFNPFVRRQTERCRTAAEIACDAAVLRGAAPAEREAYAATLVRTLRDSAALATGAAPGMHANHRLGDHKMRLREIMRADAQPRLIKRTWLYALLVIAAAPVAFVQLSWSQPYEAAPAGSEDDYPLIAPGDGVVTDFRQDTVTPVYGPDGLYHGDLYRLVIDHGAGITTEYLFKTATPPFRIGDRVRAGQQIAPWGGRENWEPLKDDLTPSATVQLSDGTGTCLDSAPQQRCTLTSGPMFAGDNRTYLVATEDARLYVNGRIVGADLIIADYQKKTAIAHGHVSITTGEDPYRARNAAH